MTISNRGMFAAWTASLAALIASFWWLHEINSSALSDWHKQLRSWSGTVRYVLEPLDGQRGAVTGRLFIDVEPLDAHVRIMNIGPRYQPGMDLPLGSYDVEVSAPGYMSQRRWVELTPRENRFHFVLDR